MKRLLSILIAVVLSLSTFPMMAIADQSAEEMVPVCVSVPSDWEAPCCWAWADDGTNAFAAWPGDQFKTLDENWYYIYVPNFVQNVIVNANGATIQTDGIVVEAGKAVWITVADDATATVSYDAQSKTAIPEYVEEFTVHAYVPLTWKTVNMWAWSAPDGTNAFAAWPGLSMTEGEDGWFTGKAPVWVNSLIINGNGGEVKTADISIEAKELWVTVYEDLSYELSDTDPNKTAENITVHTQVPADWADPCCWAWSAPDGTNAFTAWPGEAFAKDGDWYTIEVPGWINSVIINANEGGIQTTDLSVDAGKDVWVVVTDPENAIVSYEEPAAEITTTAAAPETTSAPATEPAADDTEDTSKPNTGLIVGIGAAAVAVAAGVGVAVKKKKAK